MNRQWLVNKRNLARLTQQEVADMACVKRAFYTQIENGTRNPSVATAQRIAQALNFDWPLFFADDGRISRHVVGETGREKTAAAAESADG